LFPGLPLWKLKGATSTDEGHGFDLFLLSVELLSAVGDENRGINSVEILSAGKL